MPTLSVKIILLVLWMGVCPLTYSVFAQNSDETFNENLIPFENSEGQWGYLDAQTSEVAIAPKYDGAKLFQNGVAMVYYHNPEATHFYNSRIIGWIDSTGKEVFSPQFTAVYSIEKYGEINGKNVIRGLKLVKTKDEKTGVICLPEGKWKVPPGKYDDFYFYDRNHFLADKHTYFANGKKYKAPKNYQIVSVDTTHRYFYLEGEKGMHKGVSDWGGKIILPVKYQEINYLSKAKRFLVTQFDKKITPKNFLRIFKDMDDENTLHVYLLDKRGNEIAHFRSRYNPRAVNDSIGSYQTVDKVDHYFSLKTGKPIASEIVENRNGYLIFEKDRLFGIKDKSGKVVLPAEYRRLKFYRPHFIIAENKQYKNGVITTQGKTIIPFIYQSLYYHPQQDWLSASKNGKWGMIDANGNVMVDFKYDNSFLYYSENRALVYADGKNGVIDSTGKEIIPVKYDNIFDTHSLEDSKRIFFTVEKDNRWALFNKNGEMIIPFDYGYVSVRKDEVKQGWVRIEDLERNHNGLYNIETGNIIPPMYDGIRVYDDFIIVYKYKNGDYIYQLLDANAKPMTELVYDNMEFTHGYLSCEKDGKYGVLNTKGKVLLPFKYDYLWEKSPTLLLAQIGDEKFYLTLGGKEYHAPGNK